MTQYKGNNKRKETKMGINRSEDEKRNLNRLVGRFLFKSSMNGVVRDNVVLS